MKGLVSKSQVVVEAFDWGPAITRVYLTFTNQIDNVPLFPDTFSLIIKKRNTPFHIEIAEISVIGKQICLNLKSHPENHHLSPFVYDHTSHHDRFADKIELLAHVNKPFVVGDFVVSDELDIEVSEIACPALHGYRFDNYLFDQRVSLSYGLYTPVTHAKKQPLVIWLHGAKEGGQDPRIPILGNPVSRLTEQINQDRFGGYYLLVPQAKTMWMDDGSGMYTKTGRSMYLKALKGLIDKTLDKHPEIDRQRVYLGGCSNGGFMTMKLLAAHPEMFAAAFPASEACLDDWLDDEDILKMSPVPIWFFACRADTVISADLCSVKTHKRLQDAGARNCLITLLDEIRDKSGLIKNADGTPYLYDGHWSWLEPLNNSAAVGDLSFLEWLFASKRD